MKFRMIYLNKNPSLIEYSAFNGSIKIFKYLCMNNIQLTPSLLAYSIHGNNAEIIQSLIGEKVHPKYNDCISLFEESIKCFNNDIASFIESEYVDDKNYCILFKFKYHNFHFINEDVDRVLLFKYAIVNDYMYIFNILINMNVSFTFIRKIDIQNKFQFLLL